MATGKKGAVLPITDADIAAVEQVLDAAKANAKDAHDKGNLVAFRIHKRIAQMVSPELVKAKARKERQDLARMNKDEEAMRNGKASATSSNP